MAPQLFYMALFLSCVWWLLHQIGRDMYSAHTKQTWWKPKTNFEPTCAYCTVGSYASLSVCLSGPAQGPLCTTLKDRRAFMHHLPHRVSVCLSQLIKLHISETPPVIGSRSKQKNNSKSQRLQLLDQNTNSLVFWSSNCSL